MKMLLVILLFLFASEASAEGDFHVRLGDALEIEGTLSGEIYRFPTASKNLEFEVAGSWRTLRPSGHLPPILHLRYRFPYRKSGSTEAFLLSPSEWLVRTPGSHYKIQVEALDGRRYVTCMRSVDKDSYETDETELASDPLFAFGRMELHTFRVGPSLVVQATVPGALRISSNALSDWVERTAVGISQFYGKFPVPRLVLLIWPDPSASISGVTYGEGGPYILLQISPDLPPDELLNSWQLCHEMVHLSVPNMPYEHNWLEEGVATYVEPLIRHQMGLIDSAKLWAELAEGLPEGLSALRQQGLDGNHRWGATYWGGALFCFMADVRLRVQSHNQHNLQEALRGVVAAGGSISASWDLEHFLRVADATVGGNVFHQVHSEIGPRPTQVELGPLWKNLGIILSSSGLRLRKAPWDFVRRGIAD